MENQENKEEKKNCSRKSDMRVFIIAFLTAVIVVAIYHFGLGLCRIYCIDSCENGFGLLAPKYVLVPVEPMSACGMGCPRMPGERKFHHPEFRGEHRGEKKGVKFQDRKGAKRPADVSAGKTPVPQTK